MPSSLTAVSAIEQGKHTSDAAAFRSGQVDARWYDLNETMSGPLAQEWRRLAMADPEGGFFAGPDYVHAFAAAFAGRASCRVLLLRANGQVLGLVPMMLTRVRRGAALTVRHDYMAGDSRHMARKGTRPVQLSQISPLLGLEASLMSARILAEPGCHQEVWARLPAALARLPGWDAAVVPAADPAIGAMVHAATAAGLRHRLIRLDRPMQALDPVRSAAELIAAQPKKFRQNMRRASRFAEEAGVRIDLLTDGAVERALPALEDLAGQSWKAAPDTRRGRGEAVVVPYHGAQSALARCLTGADGLRPVLAIAQGTNGLRAACLAFQTPGALTPFVLFQDAEAGRESLGHLVLHRLIDHAAGAGLPRLDFNANSGWLRAYVNRIDYVQDLTIFAPTPRGRALSILAGAASGLAELFARPSGRVGPDTREEGEGT